VATATSPCRSLVSKSGVTFSQFLVDPEPADESGSEDAPNEEGCRRRCTTWVAAINDIKDVVNEKGETEEAQQSCHEEDNLVLVPKWVGELLLILIGFFGLYIGFWERTFYMGSFGRVPTWVGKMFCICVGIACIASAFLIQRFAR